MGPSALSTRAPHLGSEIHGPGTQVDSGRTFKSTTVAPVPWVLNPWPRYTIRLRSHPQARSGGNCTLGLKSMAQVLKPTSVAQARSGGNRTLGLKSMAQVLKPTPVAQVDANGRVEAHSGGTSRLRSQS
jgi:hypothetical protein